MIVVVFFKQYMFRVVCFEQKVFFPVNVCNLVNSINLKIHHYLLIDYRVNLACSCHIAGYIFLKVVTEFNVNSVCNYSNIKVWGFVSFFWIRLPYPSKYVSKLFFIYLRNAELYCIPISNEQPEIFIFMVK